LKNKRNASKQFAETGRKALTDALTNLKQSIGKKPPRKRILSITIKRMIDESPDTSWLGEYSNKATSEFSIDRAHSLDCIENDTLQKEKLVRIADAIENDRPICEDHTQQYDCDCSNCQEEKIYTQAMEQVSELAECDCGEHGDQERNQYRYFNPSFNYVGKNGHALPDNKAEEVRKYVRQDYERMESLNAGHWCFIGIQAEAKVSVLTYAKDEKPSQYPEYAQTITSGGLWGIESDADRPYLESVESDELADLRGQLKALGFSTRAISAAFKNIEREDA